MQFVGSSTAVGGAPPTLATTGDLAQGWRSKHPHNSSTLRWTGDHGLLYNSLICSSKEVPTTASTPSPRSSPSTWLSPQAPQRLPVFVPPRGTCKLNLKGAAAAA